MNPVVHFEMPAEDSLRMSEFYSKAFSWEVQVLGPETGNYVLVTTAERDEKGFPKERGRINGGFFKKSDGNPNKYPSIVIAVENIRESMKKIEKAGGRVLGEPVEIPGTGTYVSFYDTEGNLASIIQPNPM